ncbi:MAG: hypothetical protein O3B64_02640, partial [bacterium]|nr:hypothetical protein [bacterium]
DDDVSPDEIEDCDNGIDDDCDGEEDLDDADCDDDPVEDEVEVCITFTEDASEIEFSVANLDTSDWSHWFTDEAAAIVEDVEVDDEFCFHAPDVFIGEAFQLNGTVRGGRYGWFVWGDTPDDVHGDVHVAGYDCDVVPNGAGGGDLQCYPD